MWTIVKHLCCMNVEIILDGLGESRSLDTGKAAKERQKDNLRFVEKGESNEGALTNRVRDIAHHQFPIPKR